MPVELRKLVTYAGEVRSEDGSVVGLLQQLPAAVVGPAEEIEQASALIHTLRQLDKYDEGRQSHCLTIQFSINAAPAPDEFVVALSASIAEWPHHRVGARHRVPEELDSTHG
jgi:hypothetical protein